MTRLSLKIVGPSTSVSALQSRDYVVASAQGIFLSIAR